MKKKPEHGTVTRYKWHGCRCPRCKQAIAEYVRENRQERTDFSNFTHGLRSSYNNGCRCQECRAANSEYAKNRKLETKAASLGDIG